MGVPEWMEEQRKRETRHWDDWDADDQALTEERTRYLAHDEDENRYPTDTMYSDIHFYINVFTLSRKYVNVKIWQHTDH